MSGEKNTSKATAKLLQAFFAIQKVLGRKLSFIQFDKNGLTVVKYFESHSAVAMPWTHEIDSTCGTCMQTATSVA